MAFKTFLIAIDRNSTPERYRILLDNEVNGEHQYKKFAVTSTEIRNFYRQNTGSCVNFKAANEVVTTQGSIGRYTLTNYNKLVILAELRATGSNETIGYRVADSKCNVRKIKLEDMIAFGRELAAKSKLGLKSGQLKEALIPFPNGQFVSRDGVKSEFIRSYESVGFPVEYMNISRENKNAHAANINYNKAAKLVEEKAAKKSPFTPEQMKELNRAKKMNVDIRIIANPELSPKQMRVIADTEAEGLPGRLFADPKYKVSSMLFFRTELETGGNIKHMLSPKYNLDQLYQLSRAYINGVDLRKVADPNMEASRMEQIIEDESKKTWKDFRVIEGGSKIEL